MNQYIFILGRNQELSAAEIRAVLKTGDFKSGPGFLIWQTKKEIEVEKILNQLGGTIKIGKVFTDDVDQQKIIEQITEKSTRAKKVFFGFSVYGGKVEIKKLANTIKDELKQKGHPSRWVVAKEKQLSSVVVKKNKLLTRGAEILIVKYKNQTFLGKTLAVQEFQDYSQRDYGRPARDTLSGTMPPKLAKIMINLSQVSQNETILDPFCGSGTILQEAILLGYKKLIGSDKSQKAIEDTRKNLDWLKGRYKIQDIRYKLLNFDVRQLSQGIKKVDAIVTEPYLGPPLKGRETEAEIKKIIEDLEKLYLQAFEEFQKVLKPGGRVVIIFPIFKNNSVLQILPQIKKMDFMSPGPDDLIYSRPDQKVKRRVLIFVRQ